VDAFVVLHCGVCAMQLKDEVDIAQDQARTARALVGTQASDEEGRISVHQQQLSAVVTERDAATAQLARIQVCVFVCVCVYMYVCVHACASVVRV
jgi:hypothetical protein